MLFYNYVYNLYPPIAHTIVIGALCTLCCIYVLWACIVIEKNTDFLKTQISVSFSYLSKIITDESWNTHLLIQNENRVSYDVTSG